MKTTSLPRISADSRGLIHSELTEKIIGIFYEVYNELGHGFLESVYEQALSIAFAEREIFFQRQIAVPVWFRGHQVGDFRADLLIENKVIVELKAGRAIEAAWEKQLLKLFERNSNRSRTSAEFRPRSAISTSGVRQ